MAEGIEAFFEKQDEEEVAVIGKEIDEEIVTKTTEEEEVVVEETEEVIEETETIEKESQVVQTDYSEDIETLQQLVREQAETITALQSQSERVTTALTDSGTVEESDLVPEEAEDDGNISQDRVNSLSMLAETMRMNPAYSDLDEVCSSTNFNSTINALAKLAVEEEGGTLTEQMREVSSYVWGLPNPYKFIYDIVKQHHPKYAVEEATTEKETPKAPSSLSKVAGGSAAKNEGWTSAKINALSEEDLHTVPTAVYQKYMQDELA